MVSTEVLLLRQENASLKEQLAKLEKKFEAAQADHAITRNQLTNALNQLQINNQHYHTERMAFVGQLDSKVDRLMTIHEQTKADIIEKLNGIETRITTPPDNAAKAHGFCITKTPISANHYEFRFIAGQASYVQKTIRNMPEEQIFVPFTRTGNPIDMRNNFKKLANNRLKEYLSETVGTNCIDMIGLRC